jgi:hypothetical protein
LRTLEKTDIRTVAVRHWGSRRRDRVGVIISAKTLVGVLDARKTEPTGTTEGSAVLR